MNRRVFLLTSGVAVLSGCTKVARVGVKGADEVAAASKNGDEAVAASRSGDEVVAGSKNGDEGGRVADDADSSLSSNGKRKSLRKRLDFDGEVVTAVSERLTIKQGYFVPLAL